jgi:hypothetical protein
VATSQAASVLRQRHAAAGRSARESRANRRGGRRAGKDTEGGGLPYSDPRRSQPPMPDPTLEAGPRGGYRPPPSRVRPSATIDDGHAAEDSAASTLASEMVRNVFQLPTSLLVASLSGVIVSLGSRPTRRPSAPPRPAASTPLPHVTGVHPDVAIVVSGVWRRAPPRRVPGVERYGGARRVLVVDGIRYGTAA